ncbi:MAG TPA: polysaccharide deacetylase family protein [Burkholderiales bacterium]|nr:polysaccharide deacetylase family protein [Burkholderiales bacterium]
MLRPVLLWLLVAIAGCQSPSPGVKPAAPPVPHVARFALTFDDGPSLSAPYNTTTVILDTLAQNSQQSQIKAVFFVQTRSPTAGGSARGQELLHREVNEGHLLALHSGSARGHKNHRWLASAELDQSLSDGIEDLRALTGHVPTLVRPPYWSYDERTQQVYTAHGLTMLLTDISARDGKIWGWHISLRRRSHFRSKLEEVRKGIEQDRLPIVDGVVPVVVTFHDTNDFTASHMQEYLDILVEESRRVGLPLADRPFYDDAATLERVARLRGQIGIYAAER